MFTDRFALYTNLLKQIREEAGLTQRELAQRLVTDQTRVSSYERGQRRMDMIELETYCQALGITLLEFVSRYEASKPKS